MSNEVKKNVPEEGTETECKFTKGQLVQSKRFIENCDILSALLDSDQEYTIAQAEAVIDKYLKGGVS